VNKEKYPKPILDFKNPDDYPDHGQDRRLWAWEYLRRNGEYQRLWDILIGLPQELPGAWGIHELPASNWRFGIEHGFFGDPEPKVGENFTEYRARISSLGCLTSFSDYLCQSFKIGPLPIDYMHNPPSEDAFQLKKATGPGASAPWHLTDLITFDHDLGAHLEDTINEKESELGKRFEVIGFDLGLCIDTQISLVQKKLKAKRDELIESGSLEKIKPRRLVTKYVQRHLQILDGMAVGAEDPEIRESLDTPCSGDNNGYEGAKKKAVSFRDGEYLTCAFPSKKS